MKEFQQERERARDTENGEELIRIGGKTIGTLGGSHENCNEMLQGSERDI